MKIDANEFWMRVDSRIKGKFSDLGEFCEVAELNYNTIISQRARKSVPKLEQLIVMANTLGVTLDYLISGEVSGDALTRIIRTNPGLRQIAYRITKCNAQQLFLLTNMLDSWGIDRLSVEKAPPGTLLV